MKMKRIANNVALQTIGYVISGFTNVYIYVRECGYQKRDIYRGLYMQCPFCEGENSNARVYEDKQNKEYFVYCQKCGIETKDTFTSKAKAVKAFTEGKTKKVTGSEVADE